VSGGCKCGPISLLNEIEKLKQMRLSLNVLYVTVLIIFYVMAFLHFISGVFSHTSR